jgi:hypothetical protein
MNNAKNKFSTSIADVRCLTGVHAHLTATYAGTYDVQDISRTKLVWAVSAFDKLIHDLVRIGMVETFMGVRAATAKYLAESVPLSTLTSTFSQPLIPAAAVFEQVVYGKLKHLSFQDPKKLVDGLGLIWSQPHKWEALAGDMASSADTARTTLSLIASRRNAIVHESDLDIVTHSRTPLSLLEAADVVSFLERLGLAICTRVI